MSDKMRPIPLTELIARAVGEYREMGSIFGISHAGFYLDVEDDPVAGFPLFGEDCAVPVGPAAGPHTQIAPNFLAGYLTGARFFELKTVQILDELEIAKPCIDASDECYNVEWSSEFTLTQALDEYAKAWFLLHLFDALLHDGHIRPRSFVFNMSVGYNMEGITNERVDAFIEGMKDISTLPLYQRYIDEISAILKDPEYFAGTDLVAPGAAAFADAISPNICSQISLSTMHGCPPDEIEAMCRYMLDTKKLDTYVKLNPTLLGYDFINDFFLRAGYTDVHVPQASFEKDLGFDHAVAMLKRLLQHASDCGQQFGIKLTNTLEVANSKDILPGDDMYLSGRPLYPLSINVAARLARALDGNIAISYSGGISAFNIADVVATGIRPVTICTELLKPGGYLRMKQLVRLATEVFEEDELPESGIDVARLEELAAASLGAAYPYKDKKWRKGARVSAYHRVTTSAAGATPSAATLPLLDCNIAPCVTACPIEQDAPGYLRLIREKDYAGALEIIYRKNPLPSITGRFCSHSCQKNCTRLDYEGSVQIRDLKSVALEKGFVDFRRTWNKPESNGKRVAIQGHGIYSLSAAYVLAQGGYQVDIFMDGDDPYILPDYKLPRDTVKPDVDFIIEHGVHFILTSGEIDTEKAAYKLVLDARHYQRNTIIDDIAAGRNTVEQATAKLGSEAGRNFPAVSWSREEAENLIERRGLMTLAMSIKGADGVRRPSENAASRCLDCNISCNKCMDVCPNRANISIEVPELKDRTQIIHLDALCNECGNCETFCPWQGRPYTDKLTIFSRNEDFADSTNSGFFLDGSQVSIRVAGRAYQTTIDDQGSFLSGGDIPDEINQVFRTIFRKHPYLLGPVD